MNYVLSAAEMKSIDDYTMNKIGIPSLVLMERAAQSVVTEICRSVPGDALGARPSLILCGMGNNGGDGLAVARMLHQLRGKPVILVMGEPEQGTAEWQAQYKICRNLNIPAIGPGELEKFLKEEKPGLIVDALFGIGLDREIQADTVYGMVIGMANMSDAFRVSVDIPSGVQADTGMILGIAFLAKLTVTFGSMKFGCLFYPGSYYCGRVVTADIGFPEEAYQFVNPSFFTRLAREIPALLPKRPADGHKGTFGRLTVIAGSVNMSGAAYLAALAAYRMGTGLVRIVTPEENRVILQSCLPEAILTTYPGGNFHPEMIGNAIGWADAVVAGPGMGLGKAGEDIVDVLLQTEGLPVLFDADALRIIGGSEERKRLLKFNHVLTPHMGEMSALCGRTVQEIGRDPVTAAREFSHIYETNCVLKGARTIVARKAGRNYINITGNSGMATAGSGDVLSGMIGGLMAQGMEPFEAACLGVLVHGRAGELAGEEKGERAVMASDIGEALSLVR